MIRKTNDQNGDCENIKIFPTEENMLGFRRRLSFPFGERNHARPMGLQTVFAITHSDRGITEVE
jgi:hypothetical protein